MYEATVILTAFFMMLSAVYYVRCALAGKSNPVPATWILMLVVMGLSFWMYFESPHRSWTANIAVTAGVFNVWYILCGVVLANHKHGTLRIAFDRPQIFCSVAGGVVVGFWFLTDRPLNAYTLVQIIALIAYVATIRRLLKVTKSTEPMFQWVAVLIATIFAIYPAWERMDPFSWIYLARALPSTALMVFLIGRIKWRTWLQGCELADMMA